MRILITGCGFIGSHLYKNDSNVYLFVDKKEKPDKLNLPFKQVDLADNQKLEFIILDFKPDLVIHTAANKYIDRCEANALSSFNDNLLASYNLCQLKEQYGFKLVYISTDKAVNPTSLYGQQKSICEKMVLEVGGTVVRLVNILWSTGSILPIWTELLKQGKKIEVRGKDITRKMMTIDEAVDIIYRAVDYPNTIVLPKNYIEQNIYQLALTLTSVENIILTEPLFMEKLVEEIALPYEKVLYL